MEEKGEKFPSPFWHPSREPKLVMELDMLKLAGMIRDKPEWRRKLKDAAILGKWKEEVRAALQQKGYEAEKEVGPMVEFIFAELEEQAKEAETFGVEAAGVEGVYQADNVIPQEVLSSLAKGLAALESVPEAELDWHPGSDKQVLDLVHPSLYCLAKGQHPIWPADRDENGEAAAKRRRTMHDQNTGNFQWLPAEFDVSATGSVRIASYINNLHPEKHRPLYSTLEAIFERFVPLFSRVLTDLRNMKWSIDRTIISVDPYSWYDDTKPKTPEYGDDEVWTEYDEIIDAYNDVKVPSRPPIPAFASRGPPPSGVVELKGKRLQVIVKAANIILTPEKPEYKGGVWHVEGMTNEQIVASGIYYWHSENITESRLAFRAAVDEPDYEQSDDRGVKIMYDLVNEGPLNQVLGDVRTLPGRCIAFPNVFQHQVQPFELVDKTKPGVRKILVFFLCDPTKRIFSTLDVPPQQGDWLVDAVSSAFGPSVPGPLCRLISEFAAGMSLEQAKKNREKLMEERKYFIDHMTEEVYEREFSLCEH